MQRRMLECPEGESLYEGYSDAWKKCPWNEASCTIKENHGGVNVHPKLPRVLTAREMARLQSFPDDFIFEGTKNKQTQGSVRYVLCINFALATAQKQRRNRLISQRLRLRCVIPTACVSYKVLQKRKASSIVIVSSVNLRSINNCGYF